MLADGLLLPALLLLAGLPFLYFLRLSWRFRAEPGGRWWLGVVGGMGGYVLLYGVQLLVVDRTLSEWLQYAIGVHVTVVTVCFLAFALAYTGRGGFVRSPAMGVVVAAGAALSVAVVTNPVHGWLFTDFRVVETLGAGTVFFEKGPLLYAHSVFMLACLGAAFAILAETVLAFGPLYRKQAIALSLTPLFPVSSYVVWLLELGPAPQLHLTPFLLVPHLALDTYALFSGDMFEFPPATRRVGERAAVEDLGSPVVVVDDRWRVIDLNAAARELFAVEKVDVLAAPLSELLGVDVDAAAVTTVPIRSGGRRREFKVVASPFGTAGEDRAGYSVVLQDVTAENQRKQRLTVLNRILRHNLRNDLGVVSAYAEELARTADDPERADLAERSIEITDELIELGEKARTATEALESDRERRVVDLASVLSDVVEQLSDRFDGEVTLSVPAELAVESDERLLYLVFENAVENALEHGGDEPTVEITAERADDRSVVVRISDDGPGIPDHERRVVQQGDESALEHGSGVGLWLLQWGATALGGEVAFDVDDGGTTVSVRIPGLVDAAVDGDDSPSENGATAASPAGEQRRPPADPGED